MILIFSWDSYEQGVDAVIDWLLHKRARFLKITPGDIYRDRHLWKIDVNEQIVRFDDVDLVEDVNVVWFRKFPIPSNIVEEKLSFDRNINLELAYEFEQMYGYITYLLRGKSWLGHPRQDSLNKIEMLSIAQKVGFLIPKTVITNQISAIESERAMDKIITKQMNGNYKHYYDFDSGCYFAYTSELPDYGFGCEGRFFPSLLQAFVDAEMEIRVTFVDGEIFAAAYINRLKKSSDKRKTIDTAHMHVVPISLEDDICGKIRLFMNECELNYGCIDLLRSSNGEYVFLEMNPSGQFLSESRKCFQNAEKYIANWLIERNV